MAGEWIKMRCDLHDDPAVFRIAAILKIDPYAVIGRLHTFWGWVDRHSVDGVVDGVVADDVDSVVRFEGFAHALAKAGWLEITDSGIRLPKFDRHNGESAKKRALKSERQARWRAGKDTDEDEDVDGGVSTKKSTHASTREEKRREEPNSSSTKKNSAPRFDAVAYLLSFGVDEKTIVDWLEVRRSKKLKATQTAMEGVVDEAKKAGVSVQKAIEMCCKRGWGGFDSSWLPKTNSPPGWHDQNAETIAALTGRTRDHEPDNRTIDM